MAGKEIAVKKYVVKLGAEERERLEALVRAGKSPAQLLTRARILLKADVSEAGEGWSDSAIAAAESRGIGTATRHLRFGQVHAFPSHRGNLEAAVSMPARPLDTAEKNGGWKRGSSAKPL